MIDGSGDAMSDPKYPRRIEQSGRRCGTAFQSCTEVTPDKRISMRAQQVVGMEQAQKSTGVAVVTIYPSSVIVHTALTVQRSGHIFIFHLLCWLSL